MAVNCNKTRKKKEGFMGGGRERKREREKVVSFMAN